MQRKITLRVLGANLDDEATIEQIATYLDDLVWTVVDARVRATVIIDQSDQLVCAAVDAAQRIEGHLAGSRVDRVDEELVGVSDIATRVGLNRETIRSWTTGARGPGSFPDPIGSVGGGARGPAKIWRWSDVNSWLEHNYSLGDRYSYATDSEFSEVNAYLSRAEYMVVALIQNGPAIVGPLCTESIGSRPRRSLTVMGGDSAFAVGYSQINQLIGASRAG